MTSATSKKIAVAKIALKFGSISLVNGRPVIHSFPSWAAANLELEPLGRMPRKPEDPPTSVKYDITWADGFKAEGTYKVIAGAKQDLAADIKNMWLYYAGFWRPNHMSEEKHNQVLAENPKRQCDATKALTMYSLEDACDLIAQRDPRTPPDLLPVSGNDIRLTVEFVTRLVHRAESIPPVNRTLALELRKALAVLLRAANMALDAADE